MVGNYLPESRSVKTTKDTKAPKRALLSPIKSYRAKVSKNRALTPPPAPSPLPLALGPKALRAEAFGGGRGEGVERGGFAAGGEAARRKTPS